MKNKIFPIIYTLLLVAVSTYILLDAFVIERVYVVVDKNTSVSEESDYTDHSSKATSVVITDNEYRDENISITLTEHRVNDTTLYVADVILKDPSLLKTAFAKGAYGKNVKEKTTVIAENKNALLAVNGDYYSARNGCVIRNGIMYRDFSGDNDDESLVIYADGSFSFINGDEGSGEDLIAKGALQVLTFGPALVKDGEINVGEKDEVDKAMRNNPRTAIAWYGDYHYAFIVGDGRTSESKGLSLYRLAEFALSLGAENVYNLDGGGSSTMYFNGRLINKPTTNGKKISEREVSDIVYIGY